MPYLHEYGNAYVHIQPDPGRAFPWVSVQPTQEIEWPYRVGRSIVVRVRDRAFVLGRWIGRREEEDALLSALGGRVVDDEEWDVLQEAASDQAGAQDRSTPDIGAAPLD